MTAKKGFQKPIPANPSQKRLIPKPITPVANTKGSGGKNTAFQPGVRAPAPGQKEVVNEIRIRFPTATPTNKPPTRWVSPAPQKERRGPTGGAGGGTIPAPKRKGKGGGGSGSR